MNEWDPIGVFDPGDENDESGPVDQYDCIRDPLISHLPGVTVDTRLPSSSATN